MNVPSSNAPRISGNHSLRSRSQALVSEAQPQAKRPSVVMRKFEVASLQPDGSVRQAEHIGPAMPLFEAAFSAFAHGALVTTTMGPVAVEDLEPGMKLITRDHGSQRLLWVGKMKIVPKFAESTAHDARMTRIMSDSFGFTRPERDLTAGPGARMLKAGAVMSDQDPVLVPVNQLSDGMSVIDIVPPSPVDVYHLCLPRHATIMVNGLDMESFHPGEGFQRNMGQNMLSLFLSLFPHIDTPEDFGSLNYERRPLVASNGLEVA
ncbi:MAG: Hint domain-containing protein [Roseovarius sp.]